MRVSARLLIPLLLGTLVRAQSALAPASVPATDPECGMLVVVPAGLYQSRRTMLDDIAPEPGPNANRDLRADEYEGLATYQAGVARVLQAHFRKQGRPVAGRLRFITLFTGGGGQPLIQIGMRGITLSRAESDALTRLTHEVTPPRPGRRVQFEFLYDVGILRCDEEAGSAPASSP